MTTLRGDVKFYYAVRKGRIPGVYNSWLECKSQIDGFSGPIYKKFNNYEDAENFFKGIVKRFNPKSDNDPQPFTDQWKKTEREVVRDMIHDLQQQGGLLETVLVEKHNPQENEIPERPQVIKRFNVWVFGDTSSFGKVGVHFSEGPESYGGMFSYKRPVEKTRVGLAAIVRAISICSKYIADHKMDSNECSLIVHTENRYLYKAFLTFLKKWPNVEEDKNQDICNFIKRQLLASGLRVMCVMENDKENENVLKAQKLALEYESPSL